MIGNDLRIIASITLLLLAGCGAETLSSGASDYPQLDFSVADDAGRRTDIGDAQVTRSETWARIQVMTGLADLPAFGLKLNETVGLIRFTLTETPDGLVSSEKTCQIEIRRPDVPDVLTIIPQAFVDSIPIARRSVHVDGDSITFARFIEVHGVHLSDRDNDPLPSDAEDPRVFDQDQDGKPGLTVQIGGLLEGEVQVVQRTRTRLVGQRRGGQITGLLEWTGEESVIQASNALLETPVPVEVHRDPNLSYFKARQIGEDQSCEQIIVQAADLFED